MIHKKIKSVQDMICIYGAHVTYFMSPVLILEENKQNVHTHSTNLF